MTIGERVKAARERKGFTQDELAHKLGYKSRSSINKIEKERDIPRSMIVKLAEILDVTPAYLMGWGESEPAEDPKLSKAVALISSLNDLGQDVAIQRLEELNEIGKYKQDDDNSDGKCSILFILITAAFMMLLQLIG